MTGRIRPCDASTRTLIFTSLVAALGCRPADNGGSIFTGTAEETGTSSGTNEDTSSSGNTGDGDGDGDGGPLLDVLGGADGNETNEEAGCEKVDFSFVIDNSGSVCAMAWVAS